MERRSSLGVLLILSLVLIAAGLCSFAAAAMQEFFAAAPFKTKQERVERQGENVDAVVLEKDWTYSRHHTPIPLLRFGLELFPDEAPVDMVVSRPVYEHTSVGDRFQLVRLNGDYVIRGNQFYYTTPNWIFILVGSILVSIGGCGVIQVVRLMAKS